jgi:5-methylcytosine-specific restriction protein A
MPRAAKTFKPIWKEAAKACRDKEIQSLYDRRWRRARKAFLALNPLCCDCLAQGRSVAATEVDHIQPHRGDEELFWARNNWAARCKSCHSKKTRRGE